jgi:aquaglyceroporin related protein
MGGVVGAGLVYGQYIHAIDIFEGGRHIRTQATASLFSSFAVSAYFHFWRLPCAMLTYLVAAVS